MMQTYVAAQSNVLAQYDSHAMDSSQMVQSVSHGMSCPPSDGLQPNTSLTRMTTVLIAINGTAQAKT